MAGLKWTLVGAIWGLVALASLVAWYAYDLPDLDAAVTASRPPGLTVVAADGTGVASAGQVHGQAVTVADVPPILIQAVLATEDRRFRDHWGVDPWGILRAAWANVRAGGVVQGGSTLTQQVAKTLFLGPDRTLRRKVQEALLALWLDHELSKDRILELYLNRVYLGAGTYGMDAAARRYFRRPAGDLTAYQAAVLAGLMKAPSRLNPAADPDAAHARAREVLGNLVETGQMTRTEAERIAAEGRPDLALARGAGTAGRYFGDWVLSRVDGHVGVLNDDLTVRTTLIPAAQRAAEAALRGVLADPEVAAGGATQGAVVVMAPDGAVLAMVGGRDYADSQFNRAAQARRQPGSAFKPVVWLAALEAGLTPDSTVQDAPVTVRGWSPRNHDGRYRGPVTLTEALAASINTVAVRLTEQAGRARVARLARRLGLTEIDTEAPSMALGTIEVSPLALTAAYAPFVNGGRVVFPHGIRTVTNRAGAAVYRRVPSADPPRVASQAHARAMRRMLRAVVGWGTGQAAQPPASTGLTAYGKTGTTQESRDAWFVGFVEDDRGHAALAGVWIGDDQGRPMTDIGGGGPAAHVFADLFARWQPEG
jgi:penicillin-binding protein 1A